MIQGLFAKGDVKIDTASSSTPLLRVWTAAPNRDEYCYNELLVQPGRAGRGLWRVFAAMP